MNSVASTYKKEKGGQYTKHIYIGDQRVVSKLGDVGSFGVDPRREEYAGEDVSGTSVPDYKTKYKALQQVIKDNYQLFEVDYYAIDNDNYVDGEGFCCEPQAQSRNLRSIPTQNVDYEKLQYYYHSDHLGSASYITNLDGEVVQHVEYVPFGEVFIEERNNTWNTPYLFNGKELDEETGLYYYGARYYNPRISLWYGVDPLAEKYPGVSPFAYCVNNPVKYVDPDGEKIVIAGTSDFQAKVWGYMVSLAMKSETGYEQVKNAIESSRTLVIYAGKDNVVRFGKSGGDGYETLTVNFEEMGKSKDGAPGSIEAAMGHELSHFNSDVSGTLSHSKDDYSIPGVSPDEVNALEVENSIRKELGIGERKSYSGLDFYDKELGKNEKYSGYYYKNKTSGSYAPTKNGVYSKEERSTFIESVKGYKPKYPKAYYRNGRYIKGDNVNNQIVYEKKND